MVEMVELVELVEMVEMVEIVEMVELEDDFNSVSEWVIKWVSEREQTVGLTRTVIKEMDWLR